MNIQASGLFSILSSVDGLENIQQSLLQGEGVPEQFALALQGQIDLLQQGQSETVLSAQQNADLSQLQDFAALLGKDLPEKKETVDIDLEKTMRALDDILKNINAMGDADRRQFNSSIVLTEEQPELPGDKDERSVGNNEESKDLLQENDSDQDDLAGQVPVALEILTAQKIVNKLNDETIDKLSDGLKKRALLLVDKTIKNNPGSALKNEMEQAVSMSKNNDADSTMEQNNAFQHSEVEALLSTEKKHSDAEITDRKSMDVGVDKSLPKIATELTMLNRSVNNESKAEIPVMTRHFAHPEWGKEFSERVVWMTKQAVPSAELNLNPKHLGPISIRVDVSQDQATIAFATQHAAVKDAIEAALPKLREMLNAQQLNLLDVNVSQQQSEQKQSQGFFQMGENRQGQRGMQQMDDFEGEQSDAMVSVADEIEAGRAIASKGILSIFA